MPSKQQAIAALEAYDNQAYREQREDISQQRQDVSSQRLAFEQARRESQYQQQSQRNADLAEHSQRQLELMQQQRQLDQSKFENELRISQVKLDHEQKIEDQSAAFLQEVNKAQQDPKAVMHDVVMNAAAKYPFAAANPVVRSMVDSAYAASDKANAPKDPFKVAQQIHSSITEQNSRLSETRRQIKEITDDYDTQKWLPSATGIITDPATQTKYFASGPVPKTIFGNDDYSSLTPVTPSREAVFNHYQQLVKDQGEIPQKIATLETQRDTVLAGGDVPQNAQTPNASPSPAPSPDGASPATPQQTVAPVNKITPGIQIQNTGFQQTPLTIGTGVQAPPVAVQAPDLKSLAQQALSDPNATEAHKSAARKLLGVPDPVPPTPAAPAAPTPDATVVP